MGFSLAERDKGRQIAVRVQTDMQLDRTLGFPEGGPGEKREAKIDGGGVKQIELALEFEPMGRGNLAATLKDLEKHRLKESGGLLFVHPGQMIQLARLSSHVHDNVP